MNPDSAAGPNDRDPIEGVHPGTRPADVDRRRHRIRNHGRGDRVDPVGDRYEVARGQARELRVSAIDLDAHQSRQPSTAVLEPGAARLAPATVEIEVGCHVATDQLAIRRRPCLDHPADELVPGDPWKAGCPVPSVAAQQIKDGRAYPAGLDLDERLAVGWRTNREFLPHGVRAPCV